MKTLTSNVTMNDIARLSGVSIATVSRVFSESPKVTASTRRHVLDIASKYNFQPNETARTLAASRSYLIAVVLPDVQNPYFTELLNHIEIECTKNGYTLILYNSGGDSQKEKRIVRQMISRQVDGMLITMTRSNSDTIPLLADATFPVVVMTRTVGGIDSVGIHHAEASALAAEYLLSRGTENFIYFGTQDDEKYIGFFEHLIDLNVKPEKISVIGNQDWYFNTIDSGAIILNNYIRQHSDMKKTGLFCVNDMYAAYALRAAHECGIKVPDNLSIVGFDDTSICEMVYPRLTSIHQPMEEIAKYSMEMLLARISSGSKVDTPPENILLKSRLVVRGT